MRVVGISVSLDMHAYFVTVFTDILSDWLTT